MKLLRIVALGLALMLLNACGGGGGGSEATPTPTPTPITPTTVFGTVVGGTALADLQVLVQARDPLELQAHPNTVSPSLVNRVFSTTSAADGSYSATTNSDAQPPLVMRAAHAPNPNFVPDRQYPRLYSMATGSGRANVTALTTLTMARLLNRRLGYASEGRAVWELPNISAAQVTAAQQQVIAYLLTRPSRDDGNAISPVDVSAVTNVFSMPLTATAGDPHFEALTRFHNSLMDTESVLGVEDHMLFGNDAATDLRAILALDFPVFCKLENPVAMSPLPQGQVPFVLNGRGATIGNFDLPFTTGDQLELDAHVSRGRTWVFTFGGGASSVEVLVNEREFFYVRLTFIGGSTVCTPLSNLTLSSDKVPSQTALTRLFAQSIGNSFQCTAPTALFQNGANTLAVQTNGALRINAPAGPALHLPSYNFVMRAPLVVTAGQVGPIRPTRLVASQTFRGGTDELTTVFTDTGTITGLRLSRTNQQSTVAQTCGTI